MKTKIIRKDVLLIIVLLLILSLQLFRFVTLDGEYNTLTMDYYLDNLYQDTSSNNFVTGIYLDDRYFDTIFEATLLFMTVSGVLYFFKDKEED